MDASAALNGRNGNFKPGRKANQLREGTGGHLAHRVPPMNLERNLTDAKFCSGLFVEKTREQ